MNQAHRQALRWARTLHVYLTLFGFVLLLFFAVTGFMLNHEDWFLPRQTTSGSMPIEWLGTPEDRDSIVGKLQGDFGVSGDLESFESAGDTVRVAFKSDDGFLAIATIRR